MTSEWAPLDRRARREAAQVLVHCVRQLPTDPPAQVGRVDASSVGPVPLIMGRQPVTGLGRPLTPAAHAALLVDGEVRWFVEEIAPWQAAMQPCDATVSAVHLRPDRSCFQCIDGRRYLEIPAVCLRCNGTRRAAADAPCRRCADGTVSVTVAVAEVLRVESADAPDTTDPDEPAFQVQDGVIWLWRKVDHLTNEWDQWDYTDTLHLPDCLAPAGAVGGFGVLLRAVAS